MSVIVRFPPINPFRFAEADLTLPDKFGFPSFGQALQIDSIRPHQLKEQYYQKLATSDPVCIQYHRGRIGTLNENPTELRIFEVGSNTLLKNVGLTSRYELAGVTDAVTGEQLYTEQFLFTPSSLSELNGKRRIYFELWFYYNEGGGSVYKYRGNPIELKAKHTGTALVEYNQSVNGHDILFEQLLPRFAYRIESKGMQFEPGGDYTSFEDQDRSTVTLDAEAFNVFKWDIGGFKGLPEYMIDIINRSLQCCKDGYFRVDGREYVWQDGKLDSTGGEGKHVQWRSVTLRQRDEQEGYTFTKRTIPLFTAVSYPFAIDQCWITDNFNSITVATNNQYSKVFDNEAGLDAWIGAFNTNITTEGYSSTIECDGNNVRLLNAESERFALRATVRIFPKLLTLSATTTDGRRTFRYLLGYGYNFIHYHVVCYAATSGAEELKANAFGQDTVTVDHLFTDNGNKTIRIFHNDEETLFNATVRTLPSGLQENLAKITNVTGSVSALLETFIMHQQDLHVLTSLNLSFLAPAKYTMRVLRLTNCQIEAFAANWASSLVAGTLKPYPFLRQTELTGNSLSSSEVDAFINEFYNYCKITIDPSASINLKFQTPAGPPTGTSSTARNGFTNTLLWKLTTD